MKGGSKVVIEQHRHAGVFIARGKEDALVTFNMSPGIRSVAWWLAFRGIDLESVSPSDKGAATNCSQSA